MNAVLNECRDLPEVRFEPGDHLITEGATGDRMYVLIEGQVQVLKGAVEVASEQVPGALFGEMSALLGTPYSASVKAGSPVRAYLVSDPHAFLEQRPGVAVHAAQLLAQRLQDATTYLADLKVQFQDQESHFAMVDQVLDALMNQQRSQLAEPENAKSDPRL